MINKLTIIKEVEKRNNNRMVLCKCECGNEVVTYLASFKNGHSKSCGCLLKERKNALKHGLRKHPVYRIWDTMKQRCTNQNNAKYHRYGARGIKVCDEWLNDPKAFIEYMGERPEGYTIDRINNDGNYEPGNVRWATQKEQQNNRSNNKITG